MKLTKILGLAAVAAAAAMAFVGAGTAAATPHPLIGLCTVAELLSCKTENKISTEKLKFGLILGLQIGSGTFEGVLTEQCTGSMFKAKTGEMGTNAKGENTLAGEVTELTFSGCEPCKKYTMATPYKATLAMGTEGEAGGWSIEGSLSMRLTECPFGVTCKFGSENLTPKPIIEMNGTESILNTNKTELKLEEGSELICGKTEKWNSKYSLRWTLFKNEAHTEKIGEDTVFPTLVEENTDV